MVESIRSEEAPIPVGPYSQAVRACAGDVLFSAGQIAIDPSTGEMCPGGVAEQTRRVMENLKAVLEAGGFGFADVVKTTVYMSDMGDFITMNKVYKEYFSEPYPARSCFGVTALPKGALVEIDLVAVREAG